MEFIRGQLKRPNGYLVAAFTEGVPLESILRLAEADERYMRALERREPLRREAIGVKDESGMHTSMGCLV